MIGRLLLYAGVVACAAGCREGRAEAAPRLAVGATAPAAWASAPEEVVVGWMVTPEQLVTCETAAYQLRAWRARFGPAVAISVVTVGSEPELVRAFLRAQRLSGVPVHMLSRREFRSTFGSPAEPMLFVVREGRIRGRMSANRLSLLDPARVRAFGLLVDSLRAGRNLEAPRSSPSPISRGQP